MSLSFSRERMRFLKNERDEEINLKMISTVVSNIYSSAIHFAETHSETIFTYEYNSALHVSVDSINGRPHSCISATITKNDIIKKIDAILTCLRSLFPDCSVEYVHSSFAKGRDGKDYDISTIDDKMRAFIDMRHVIVKDLIIIDWS